jgi:hypothetical protein
MWRELIQKVAPGARFSSPASAEAVLATEEALGVRLPDELRMLLSESDGVEGSYAAGVIWPVDVIRAQNLTFRTRPDFRDLYMPFDCMLFFADTGDGGQFFYALHHGSIKRTDVFLWNQENDSRTWTAPSLRHYLEGWLSGRLKVGGREV